MKLLKLLVLVGLTCVVFFLGFRAATMKGEVDPTLTSILNMDIIEKGGRDVLNELGITDIKDVKLYLKGDNISFVYGKFEFDIPKDQILNKDMVKSLEKLNIKIKKNNNGDYVFYYKGEKITQIIK